MSSRTSLLGFCVLAYGLTWMCWLPIGFARAGRIELPVSAERLATLGQFGPFEPTGKRVKFSFAGMFRVEDEKLAEFWVTRDQMTILSQLGLLPGGG